MCYCTPNIRTPQCDSINCVPSTNAKPEQLVKVLKKAPQLGAATLCRLMDDCLPEQIDSEQDMQKLIDKLWPALVCELEAV